MARAWTDPAYRDWLFTDSGPAIASLGFTGRAGTHIVALENTPTRHNMVVCTLCSCYPWPVLGLLDQARQVWRRAAARTPHGHPIEPELGAIIATCPET